MIFKAKHQGKWVACKDDKVVASSLSFDELNKKVEKIGNPEDFIFTLVPKGFICPGFTSIPGVQDLKQQCIVRVSL